MRRILTNTEGQWFMEMYQDEYEKVLESVGKILTKLIDGEMTIEEMKEDIRENTGMLTGDDERYGDAREYFPRDLAIAMAELAK